MKHLLTLCLFGLAALLAPAIPAAAERPNILFIMTDDQAFWTVGAAGENQQTRTPNTDRLMREGAWLRNAFTVTPVCSPSRASTMTSRYGSEVGITDWINPRREPDHGLDPATLVWPRLLADAGYSTGLVGKWHLGLLDSQHPTKFGYQYFMGMRGGGSPPKDPVLEIDGKQVKTEGYVVNTFTDHALKFIEANKDKPFALSVHYREPHAAWRPMPDEDWAQFKDIDAKLPNPDYPKLDIERLTKMTPEYLGSVASVDRNVGRMLAKLQELGIADRTIVIYTSDHGYSMGHNGIWHKGNGHWVLTENPPATDNIPNGQRPNMYDNSIRVPCIIRWPGVVTPGKVVEETVTNLDWFPTLLAMAKVDLPSDAMMRGRNIVPLLQDETRVRNWDNDYYGEYSTHHQAQTHMRAYRTPQWKLVRDFKNPGRDELYDLRRDPAETTNLIGDPRPEIRSTIEELDSRIRQKMKQLKDPVLEQAGR